MSDASAVLLVDDDEDALFFLRTAFAQAGYAIPLQEVRSGAEAIAYLKGDAPYDDRNRFPFPAFMLLDLNMPLKNGFDVLAWVRAQAGIKRLPITVLTASARAEDIERAFDLGANSFLVKPGSLDALTGMIRCLRDWMRINRLPSLEVR